MFRLLFISVIVCFSTAAQAQFELSGRVLESEQTVLPYASVVLLNAADSSIKTYALCNEKGEYQLLVKDSSAYLLQYTFLGYAPLIKPLVTPWNTKKIQLKDVLMQKRDISLKTVVIEANRVPMKMKGDTLVYDAEAFTTEEGDDVETLLELLPGVSLDNDGNLIVQGQKVEKVMVNGKDFFGDDPKMATKNLDAVTIDKVEIVNQKSEEAEFTGVDDGKEEKAINLVLKEEYNKGQFGKIEAAGGSQESYRGKINYNRFNEKTQSSLLGNTNNLNEQSFSMNDFQTFNNNSSNRREGINESYAGGLNLNHEQNEKHQLNFNYTYRQSDNEIERNTNSQFFSPTEEYQTTENSTSSTSTKNHSLSGRYNWKVDSSTHLVFRGNFRYNLDDRNNQSQTIYTPATADGALVESQLINSNDVLNTDLGFSFRRKLKKQGRSLIADYNYTHEEGEQINDLRANTFGEELNQLQDFDENRNRHRFNTSFTETLNKIWFLNAKYNFLMETDEPSRNFFDRDSEGLQLNDSLSDQFKRETREQEAELLIRRNTEKTYLTIGARAAEVNLKAPGIDRFFYFIYPTTSLRYVLSKTANIRLNYTTRSATPNLNQLISIPNNTNPNQNYTGNINLIPEYSHQAMLSFYRYDLLNKANYYLNLNYGRVFNKIINQTTINDDFTAISSPINSDFYESMGASAGINRTIKKLKISYQINPSYNLNNYDAFINNLASRAKSEVFNLTLELSKESKERWDLSVGSNFNINQTTYTVNSNFNQEFSTFKWYAKGKVDITKSLTLMANYSIRSFNAASFSDERIIHLVNIRIQQSIRKGQWLIYLSGNDILNQNIGLQRSSGLNNLSENNFNTRTQFFMLGLSRKFGKRRNRRISDN